MCAFPLKLFVYFHSIYVFKKVDFWLSSHNNRLKPAQPIEIKYLTFEQEIALGPSFWLWDYLRRSGASGYFLPLSGGADSASTAALVGIMCQNVVKAIENGDTEALKDVRRVLHIKQDDKKKKSKSNDNVDDGGDVKLDDIEEINEQLYVPKDAQELCGRILHTTYMGTTNSSKETRQRAIDLSKELGSYHLDVDIDILVNAMIKLFEIITGKKPKYKINGGTWAENLALQNIQARLRMVLAYFLAQLLPWIRGSKGFLLVLGSANVDEALRGYYTKYDCSGEPIT